MHRLAPIVASFLLAACSPQEGPVSKSVEGNAGTLTWAVGSEVGEVRLSKVENRLDDGVLHLKAWGDTALGDPAGGMRVPVVLHGAVPVDRPLTRKNAGPLGLTATIPQAGAGSQRIPILKIIARDVDGISADWTCEVKSRREVVCNDAHVMPWLDAMEAPPGGFRAFFGFN